MRRSLIAFIFVALLIGGFLFFRAEKNEPLSLPTPQPGFTATSTSPSSTATAVPEFSSAAPTENLNLATELNAPGATIRKDFEVINSLLAIWQTNFLHEGNPVGENREITSALTGRNSLHIAFISPKHPAINADGELCDRWGTPFRFHQLSGAKMEIRSAGPDKKFGTADDAMFTPD